MIKESKKIGLVQTTSLVIGNMVGSGIFMLPASLALYGNVSMVGWFFSFTGAMIIALIFGKLSELMPHSAGGPYEYTKQTFGEIPAFIVAWSYWTSIWFANAAILVALLGYLTVFFPVLKENTFIIIITGWLFILLFTWINTKSIQIVSKIQLFTTVMKIIPLLLVGFVGLFYVDFSKIDFDFEWRFSDLTAVTTLTFFAFLGIETATITSDKVAGDDSIVKKATIFGTFFTAIVYIFSSFVVMSMLSPKELVDSASPFADASSQFLGSYSKYIIAAGAIFSTIGALNGWILIQGHIPMAAAQDKIFPPMFGVLNKNNAPAKGIMITSMIIAVIMILNYIESFVSLFTMLITLSTLSVMVPYFFSISAYFVTLVKNKSSFHNFFLPLVGFVFLIWVVVGSGVATVLKGLSFLVIGMIFYFFTNYKKL